MKQKLFETSLHVDGKEVQRGAATPVAQTLTAEQVASMGLDGGGGGEALPGYTDGAASNL